MSRIEPKGCYDLGNDVSALLFEETLVAGNGGGEVTTKWAELRDCDGEFLTRMDGEQDRKSVV